ncbi:MAG TPA: 3-hydroxyacyl-CoA dehydrogenase NAD-binding domain-containing protein [bacterium]
MSEPGDNIEIGVLGAGTMGAGIAQVAAMNSHDVFVYDIIPDALATAKENHGKILNRLVQKGKISSEDAAAVEERIKYSSDLNALEDCGLVIEAVVEDLRTKCELIAIVEGIVPHESLLATNTSSLSIASIASACRRPDKFIGIHFFNPVPIMPLVEIVPGINSSKNTIDSVKKLIGSWDKSAVIAKDTPGFIVNRIARPFYGEALRIYEEGIADIPTIDWSMRKIGGFRMGPFELMDFIGNDVNFAVTKTVFKAFFNDPRYKPSFTQQRLVEAGMLGRKSGRGFYDYREGATNPSPTENEADGEIIVNRILAMLINEAVDSVFWNIASPEDIDTAMTKGVNYPQGLLMWGNELGLSTVLDTILDLRETYFEDRYRPSPLLVQMVNENWKFFD